jgi:DNA polymerase-3 subunit delta
MRLVVIYDADSLKADKVDKFLEYLEDPAPTTCLVFTASTWKGIKGSGLYNSVSKKGSVKAFNRLSEGELARWIKDEAARQGKKLTHEAVEKLLSIAGGGLRDIKGELDKVVIFAGPREVVDADCVESVGSEVRGETSFDLADAIGRKDAAEALRIFSKISAEEPLKILGAVTRQIRILLKLKALLKKRVEQRELPALVGVPFKYLKGYLASSSRFTEEDLMRAFGMLRGVDLELKSSPVPGRLIMSRLIVDLCSGWSVKGR